MGGGGKKRVAGLVAGLCRIPDLLCRRHRERHGCGRNLPRRAAPADRRCTRS
ncbi:MAG: hypothetical protein BJ554DRAFT_4452, partial [Olpidium bornovanus]